MGQRGTGLGWVCTPPSWQGASLSLFPPTTPGTEALPFLQGLNPGKAIAEIKKMMATYKEKRALA